MLCYVGLHTAAGEVTALDYGRQAVVLGIIDGSTGNLDYALWSPTSGWGDVVEIALYAAISGGTPLYQAATLVTVSVLADHVYAIAPGAIRLIADAAFDSALFDEVLFDQEELGEMLPVDFGEFEFPAPSPVRVLNWTRRTV